MAMRQRLVIFCCVCRRFKSGMPSGKGKEIQAIIRLRHENELLFGKLLESSTARRKRLEKMNSKTEVINANSIKLMREDEKSRVLPPPEAESKVNKKSDSLQKSFCSKSLKSDKTDTTSNEITNNTRANDTFNVVAEDGDSLFSVPLLNVKKNKYIVNSSSDEKRIGKLSNYYPDYNSVSEILNKSMSVQSKANLEKWKTNMISKLGQEEFISFNKNQMLRGSIFRSNILKYLNGVPESELKMSDELKTYWTSTKAVFPVIQNIVDTGGLVAHQKLKYKGVFDCLAVFRNEVMLVSWKKSDKFVPSLERTFDIPLQIAAYMGALNFDNRYPFRVEQALLVMAYNDGSKADLFHMNEERCDFYWKLWLERLNTYHMRVREENQLRREGKIFSAEVCNNEKPMKEKINIDDEVEKAVESQFSKRIIKESEENQIRSKNHSLLYPLSNPDKADYDPALKLHIHPSVEYENDSYPSVSSILSSTKSEYAKYILEQWRQMMIRKLGLEGFEKYEKETLESGSTLHEYLRIRFAERLDSQLEIPEKIEGFWQSLYSVFPRISDVLLTESKVAHPLCKYRGIIDCIGFYQNKLVLIDWKTSGKMKTSISTTYDAPLQVAAYIGALNFDSSYPFKVEEGVIVVAYNDGQEATVFHMDKEKCSKYWKRWLERLHKYQTIAYENGTKIQY